MGAMTGVYVQLDVFCMFIIAGLGIAAKFCLNKMNKRVKPLIVLTGLCYGVALLADVSKVLFLDKLKMSKAFFWCVSDIYFIMIMLGAYCWLLYVMAKGNVKVAHRKDVKILLIIPAMVVGIFVILAPVNGWIYKYVGDILFMRGQFYALFLAVPAFYYLVAMVIAVISAINPKEFDRFLYINICIASLVVVGGNLLQYRGSQNIVSIGYTVSLLIFFFNRIIKTGWEQRTEIDRFCEIKNCLERDYTSIYYVDFEKDSLIIYHQDDYTREKYGEIAEKGVFSETMQYICAHGVFPGDKNAFLESIKPDYIKKQLKKNNMFSTRFRISMNKETKFVEMRIWPTSEEENKVVLGFYDIDEMVRTERDNLTQSRAIQYMTLAQALTEHFKAIYYVNLSDNTYTVMATDDELKDKVASYMVNQNEFFNDVLANIQKIVYEDDRHILRDFFTKEKLLSNVERDKSTSVDFRLYINDEPVWFRAKVVRILNELGKDSIAVGISGITDEKKSEIDKIQNRQVIKALAREYTGLYYVNVLTGSIKIYSVSDRILADTGKIVGQKDIDFSTAFTTFIKASVHPEDCEMLKEALMTYREMLSDKQSFSVMFRRNYNGEYLYTEMIVYKNEALHDTVRSVVIGFRERDMEYKAINEFTEQ